MPSQTAALVREVLAWFLMEDPPSSNAKIDAYVTEFLIFRATKAHTEGVRRYVPVDGHDWHRKEEEHTAETS